MAAMMLQLESLKLWLAGRSEFGERGIGALIRETRERTQRLEFADGRGPTADVGSPLLPPRLDGHRELGNPQSANQLA